MNINRYNYEEFFLLYVDNELTKEERAEVETFVQENPDLEEELVMLKQSSLRPDANVKFPGKSSLMKPEAAGIVNETNYEEFYLLYTDNELETVLRKEVELFAASKPHFQQELNLLMEARIQPETAIVFPDKSLLYKEESDRKPVIMMWWRVTAIAAMLLLALGIFWLNNRNGNVQPGDSFAVKENKKEQPTVTKQSTETLNNTEAQDERKEPVNSQQLAVGSEKKSRKNDIAPKNEDEKKDFAVYTPNNTVTTDPGTQQTTELPVQVATVAGVYNTKNINSVLAAQANRTNTLEIVSKAYVPETKSADQVQATPDVQEDVYIANTTVDRKNKLRGLFRKVTRVFEKTTNLPAVEEKGILIGNFEIALK